VRVSQFCLQIKRFLAEEQDAAEEYEMLSKYIYMTALRPDKLEEIKKSLAEISMDERNHYEIFKNIAKEVCRISDEEIKKLSE